MAKDLLRAHPDFARAVRRLVREGTSAERRRVTVVEVTQLLSRITPANWPAFRANVNGANSPEQPK